MASLLIEFRVRNCVSRRSNARSAVWVRRFAGDSVSRRIGYSLASSE
ncbi:hypothetical protein [Sphingomonas sp.]